MNFGSSGGSDLVQNDFIDNELLEYNQIKDCIRNKIVDDENNQFNEATKARHGGRQRFILPYNFLKSLGFDYASGLLQKPFRYYAAAQDALKEVVRDMPIQNQINLPSGSERFDDNAIRLGLTGWLGAHGVNPRGLHARLAHKMVCVEGVVTKCSLVNPKLVSATFLIPELGRHIFRENYDAVAVLPPSRNKTQLGSSLKDSEGHAMEMEIGLSAYKDSQRITIQETIETVPTGQLPRSVEVVLEEDLVDSVHPGERVRVYGVLRAFMSKENDVVSGYAKRIVVANNVEVMCQTGPTLPNQSIMVKHFREIARRPDTLEIVAASLAPSISGHERVKKGLALQLVGGERKSIEAGFRQRGDIHVLLLGDPSCGKSQLLRFMMKMSPMAISTTGRGSSAVGLTAAVVSDADSGERRLEAGAMVLADGGLVCIDEFDKMGHDDRVAVHEVMEQQRVSINKAGITATLNARTSVLAAANPLYGLFDDNIDFSKQINFPDSLLSRFDLIYLIREAKDEVEDRRIATQVVAQMRVPAHQTALGAKCPAVEGLGGQSIDQTSSQALVTLQPSFKAKEKTSSTKKGVSIWTAKPSAVCDAKLNEARRKNSSVLDNRIFTVEFLTQYLQYCRHNCHPKLTSAATEDIALFYADLRKNLHQKATKHETRATHAKAIPTPRLLEACIRLATAHAKLKLKDYVDADDVAEAKKLLNFTLCGQTDSEQEISCSVPSSPEVPITPRSIRQSSSKKKRRVNGELPALTPPSFCTEPVIQPQSERTNFVLQFIEERRKTKAEEDWSLERLHSLINRGIKLSKEKMPVFSQAELKACLQQLQTKNKAFMLQGHIHII